jgi:serine protease Do
MAQAARSAALAAVFAAAALPRPACADTPPAGSPKALAHALENAFVQVADEVAPAVVTITARRTVRPEQAKRESDKYFEDLGLGRGGRVPGFRSQGTGSGVLVSADGWVITNDHVVAGADRVTVKLKDGREFEGAVRRDYRTDLAVIKIEGTGLPFARVGDSDKVRTGQWAIAIGSPFRYEGSFSVGVVSALGRKQNIRDTSGEGDGRLYANMIQTDAAINPGNSGGPLINLDGEVVGINTAIESDSGQGVGIGFAVPSNFVKFVTDQLREKGVATYGSLGIEPETLTPRLAAIYKVEAGALVTAEPAAGTPAAKAGIHVDDVIVEVAGKPVRSEVDFRLTVMRTAPGATVPVKVMRGGVEQTLKATVTAPPARKIVKESDRPGAPSVGVEVSMLTRDAAVRVGLGVKNGGVVVRMVDSTSPAADTEIKSGDVILQVNGQPTPSVDAFRKITTSLKSGDVVRVIYTGKRGLETVKRLAIFSAD